MSQPPNVLNWLEKPRGGNDWNKTLAPVVNSHDIEYHNCCYSVNDFVHTRDASPVTAKSRKQIGYAHTGFTYLGCGTLYNTGFRYKFRVHIVFRVRVKSRWYLILGFLGFLRKWITCTPWGIQTVDISIIITLVC